MPLVRTWHLGAAVGPEHSLTGPVSPSCGPSRFMSSPAQVASARRSSQTGLGVGFPRASRREPHPGFENRSTHKSGVFFKKTRQNECSYFRRLQRKSGFVQSAFSGSWQCFRNPAWGFRKSPRAQQRTQGPGLHGRHQVRSQSWAPSRRF